MHLDISELAFHQKYLVYCLKQDIQNKIQETYEINSTVRTTFRKLISMHELVIDLIHSIKKVASQYYEFWKEVAARTPNAKEIIAKGALV